MMRFLAVVLMILGAGAGWGCNGAKEASASRMYAAFDSGGTQFAAAERVPSGSLGGTSTQLRNSLMDPSQAGRFDQNNPFTKSGAGSLTLGGLDTFSGGTMLSSGMITVNGGAAIGGGRTVSGQLAGSGQMLTLASTGAAAETEQQRLVIYNANLMMVVPDIAQTMTTIQKQTKELGGYMQELAGGSIAVRVPVAKFDEAMSGFEKLGEVTARRIKADDITEQMVDLKVRLENSEAMRKRLLDLVDKSVKMEDTLKIEQELQRVSETCEMIKGKIKFFASQAAFSTVRIDLNSPVPQPQQQTVAAAPIPFGWVRALADGAVSGIAEAAPDTSRWERRGIKMTLPASYIRYFERDYHTEAMSAAGVIIKLQRQDNYEGGDLAFWGKLAHRTLTENRGISVDKEYDTALNNKVPARVLVGVKDAGNKKTGYVLVLVPGKRYVYTYEAWGDQAEITKDFAGLEAAAKTMDVAK